jgi:hypothetical protein
LKNLSLKRLAKQCPEFFASVEQDYDLTATTCIYDPDPVDNVVVLPLNLTTKAADAS